MRYIFFVILLFSLYSCKKNIVFIKYGRFYYYHEGVYCSTNHDNEDRIGARYEIIAKLIKVYLT